MLIGLARRLDEPGELLWAKDGWSLADVPVASAAQLYEVVSGLDSQGCSTRRNNFDLERFFNISECSPVAVFA